VANLDSNDVSIRLNACDPNLAPTVAAPASQTVPGTGTLTFSSANGNAVTIGDPDIGTYPAKVSLAVSHGTLTLASTSGLTFTTGAGTNAPSMTFTGTLTNVNTALNGLRYIPTPAYSGADQLSISVDDQGKSGVDGARTANGSVAITVPTGTTPPTATNDSYTAVGGVTLTVPAPGVLANDAAQGAAAITATQPAGPSHGSLTLNQNGGFTYTPDPGFAGTDSFTYRASNGTLSSNAATVTIAVAAAQLPGACTPSPRVQASPAGGKLQVHVTSTPLNTQQPNPISELRFGIFQNARVTLNGQPITNGQHVAIPANTTTADFTVERVTPGQPTTVPFAVVDGCGAGPTFVGGGAAAGF
jgi:VCBS repeat-containing protein